MTKIIATTSNRSPNVFHSSGDCTRLTHNYREASDNEIDRLDIPPCKYCHGDAPSPGEKSQTCPMCGETVKQLGHHLPCND